MTTAASTYETNTERFNVVLQGTTLRGQNVAAVASELARLIKRDVDLALRLLRGQPTQLKSGVDAATGARCVEALERIGCAVRLEPETLDVDADPSALPLEAAPDPASVAGVRIEERVQAEGKFRAVNPQSDLPVQQDRFAPEPPDAAGTVGSAGQTDAAARTTVESASLDQQLQNAKTLVYGNSQPASSRGEAPRSSPSAPPSTSRKEIYATIADELDSGNLDRSTWTKAFAEANGDTSKTRAAYIRHRAMELQQSLKAL